MTTVYKNNKRTFSSSDIDAMEENCFTSKRTRPGSYNDCIWSHRILSEYKDFHEGGGSPWGISAQIMDNDVSLWAVQILGPIGTPYQGGYFQGILQFSDQFPYHPPTFTFLTPIFHPNISESGDVCVEQLYKHWTPCHTVWSLLVSIQFVLANVNAEDVLNSLAALYYKTDREQFKEIVTQAVDASREDLKDSVNTFNNVIDWDWGHKTESCAEIYEKQKSKGVVNPKMHWKDRRSSLKRRDHWYEL